MTVLIQLTTAGTDTGPFNLYSNLDSCGTGSCNKSKPINIVQGIATDCCDCDD
ncbi:MAG: hypothetical protein ACK518_01950 [bacterium]|jgi:hypothetical protein